MNKEINIEEFLSKSVKPKEENLTITANTKTNIINPLTLSGTTAVCNVSGYHNIAIGCSVGNNQGFSGGNVTICGGQSNRNARAYSCVQSQCDIMNNYYRINNHGLYE
jgi:hypothetical protein